MTKKGEATSYCQSSQGRPKLKGKKPYDENGSVHRSNPHGKLCHKKPATETSCIPSRGKLEVSMTYLNRSHSPCHFVGMELISITSLMIWSMYLDLVKRIQMC
jgi:hypothetical protein